MMNHEAEIRKYIFEKFLFGEEQEVAAATSLIEAGIVDSTGILELIGHLETSYGIKVENDELVPENLDTVANICAFLDRKIAQASGQGV
jgi:acyl carrier protein